MGPPLAEAERDEPVHFLTARYRLFTMIAGRLAAAEAEHCPWPPDRAKVLGLDQDLLRRAGLPAPAGDPVVHASREYRCGSAGGTGDQALGGLPR